MSNTTTIKVGESAKTLPIPEGKVLVLSGSDDAAGVAYLLDPVLGGTNSTQSWTVGPGALPQIGPFDEERKVLVYCYAGIITGQIKIGQGGGGSYTLPVATPDTLGGVKPDGTSITVDGQGKISAPGGNAAEGFSVLGFGSVTTPASPTAGAVASPVATDCNCVIVRNNTGVVVEFNRSGGATFYRIRPGEVFPVFGITNANQIGFRGRDYAASRDSLRVAVNLTFANTSLAYPVVQLVAGTASGTAYQVAPAQVCVGAELTNNYNKDILIKIGAGVTKLPRNQTMVVGVTNVNQISCVSPDSTGGAAMCVQAFTSRMPGPGAPAREYSRADILSPEATIPLGDMQNAPFDQPAGIADFAPFKRIKAKRKSISSWSTAARTIVTAGLSVANVALAAEQVYATYGHVGQFGASTAPNVTFTTDTTASILTTDNTPAPIDVTGGAIHVTVQKVTPATGGFTAMNIDLFSTGTPGAPGRTTTR